MHPESTDLAIIGAGPAGLAVADTLQRAGRAVHVVEKGCLASHIAEFPPYMQFFSTRDLLEIGGFPFTITEEKPSRQQYLGYLSRFAAERRIPVERYTAVEAVDRAADGDFLLRLRHRGGAERTLAARFVVAACGAFGQPRLLGVPGEELAKVSHRFTETHHYVGQRVLVVGGRNSAIEVALALWRAGARVDLSYRGASLDGIGIKYWLKPDIENRLANGEIGSHLSTTVERIDWDRVTLRRADGARVEIPNDFVLAMTGYDPPVGFLSSMGIRLAAGTNIPEHDPTTLETNVPGLFVAGTIVSGNVSGKVFIENSRHHGEMILGAIEGRG